MTLAGARPARKATASQRTDHVNMHGTMYLYMIDIFDLYMIDIIDL
jgi:hypothetical protein